MSAVLCPLFLLAGCHYGTRPSTFRPALGPTGATVAVRATGDSTDRVGELFAVDSIGVTVRSGQLVRVAWMRLVAMDVDKASRSVDVRPREVVTAEKRRRIAALSRFPQGLTGELLAAVLRELRQDSIVEIARADLDSVSRRAELSAARYANRSAAIADGYRRIGGDFPGMGEHWVNPNRIQTRDSIDATRPSFLSYAAIGGQPRLLGVGFIVTSSSDTGGVHLPGWPEEWHEHSGLLGDESAGRPGRSASATASRVFVLHIWTTLTNPDGRHAPDNWLLPYVRSGRVAPASIDVDAARALSLTVGGDDFLRATLSDLELLRGAGAAGVDSVLLRAKQLAAGARDEGELRHVWRDLDLSLQRLLGPAVADVMRPAHQSHRDARAHAHGSPR